MTSSELWRHVGKRLAAERKRRHWSLRDVERAGGPNYSTVDAHEHGAVRTTAALDVHLAAFGWRLELVLRQILGAAPLVSGDAVLGIVNAYDETTDAGRTALEMIAS